MDTCNGLRDQRPGDRHDANCCIVGRESVQLQPQRVMLRVPGENKVRTDADPSRSRVWSRPEGRDVEATGYVRRTLRRSRCRDYARIVGTLPEPTEQRRFVEHLEPRDRATPL